MLNDDLKPYGCTIHTKTLFGDSQLAVTISYPSINLVNQIIWHSTLNSFERSIKPVMHQLMCVFCNGGRLHDGKLYDNTTFQEFIDINTTKLTPETKLDELLYCISSQTAYDGQAIELKSPTMTKLAQMRFANVQEWRFYLRTAESQSYLTKTFHTRASITSSGDEGYNKYALTVDGLSKLIKASEGKDSKTCFIAMAFVDDMFKVLEESIKPALTNCGFSYTIVSEEHIDSDKTINDAILAGVKKASFMIADFTYHRGGVYFEAGYGLGRGKKVIYTCNTDHMANAHFDIRNYQHIVWKDTLDFKTQLINKIEAFIKD
jgi:nucleoside 2-deoxyribosyltransferase